MSNADILRCHSEGGDVASREIASIKRVVSNVNLSAVLVSSRYNDCSSGVIGARIDDWVDCEDDNVLRWNLHVREFPDFERVSVCKDLAVVPSGIASEGATWAIHDDVVWWEDET